SLAWTRRRAIRRAAAPALLVAALVFALGSKAYVESFSDDRFFAQGPATTPADLIDQPIAHTSLPFATAAIRLAPDGGHVAVGQDADAAPGRAPFPVGRRAGPFEPIECDELFFLSDARLLTVSREREAVVLQERRIAQPQELLHERRVDLASALVTVDQS